MFRENTADVLRWVLHEPLQQVWADTPKNDRQIYPLISPTDFFQAFSKASCLICITPSPVDCSHLIVLSFCHVSLCRHQQSWGSKRTQAHTYTYRNTHAQTLPAAASRALPAHPARADAHGIPQERQNDSMLWADTLVYTLTPRVQHSARHTCTAAFTSPPSTAVWEQFPHTDYDA